MELSATAGANQPTAIQPTNGAAAERNSEGAAAEMHYHSAPGSPPAVAGSSPSSPADGSSVGGSSGAPTPARPARASDGDRLPLLRQCTSSSLPESTAINVPGGRSSDGGDSSAGARGTATFQRRRARTALLINLIAIMERMDEQVGITRPMVMAQCNASGMWVDRWDRLPCLSELLSSPALSAQHL